MILFFFLKEIANLLSVHKHVYVYIHEEYILEVQFLIQILG